MSNELVSVARRPMASSVRRRRWIVAFSAPSPALQDTKDQTSETGGWNDGGLLSSEGVAARPKRFVRLNASGRHRAKRESNVNMTGERKNCKWRGHAWLRSPRVSPSSPDIGGWTIVELKAG
ncbi:hypothetical protein ANO11243_086410 [Dothideomycetidae sp. 11243]|nr:hypothetical protein ANO11243_086410 [fungal sp. No.11243]